MDLQINDNSDLVIDGDLVFVRSKTAIAQSVEMRLGTWLAESPYDEKAGLPYQTIIFQPNTNAESVKFILEQHILNTPAVTGVDLDFTIDSQTRTLTVTGTVTANDVEVDFSVNVRQ